MRKTAIVIFSIFLLSLAFVSTVSAQQQEVQCPTCEGTGTVSCPRDCDLGSIYRNCRHCDRGWVRVRRLDPESPHQRCTRCFDGVTRARCPNGCRRGWLTCSRCGGDGVLPRRR